MPDLSHEASTKYWSEFPDPSIYKAIAILESVETWTADGDPALESALKNLGKELDDFHSVDVGALNEKDRFIRIVGNIKTSRGLRLLQAIDVVHPGSASKVLVHAESTTKSEKDHSGCFLKRNIAFERLRILYRMFCEKRLKTIVKALEGVE